MSDIDLTLEAGQTIDLTLEASQTAALVVETDPIIDLTLETGQTVDVILQPAPEVTLTVSFPSPPGPPGEDGKSAYEIAVENGFVGTEAEWLASLVGLGTETYVHVQGVPDSDWIIVHNLDAFPSVTIVDSSARVVLGTPEYIDSNTIIVHFSAAFGGKAYLN